MDVAMDAVPPPRVEEIPTPPAEVSDAERTARARSMRQFYTVAISYLLFTLTDGAFRVIVLLQANAIGFSAFQIALMFTLYEAFGVITNLAGGVLGSRAGLKTTLVAGFVCQILSLASLAPFESPSDWRQIGGKAECIVYVMFAQAFAGMSKDLVKIAGKSVGKLVTSAGDDSRLYMLVARLTGFKNEIKGLGFFVGTFLLRVGGFRYSLVALGALLAAALPFIAMLLPASLGRSSRKIDLAAVFRKGAAFNTLCAARMFLFGSRDVWFEVALPIFIKNIIAWPSLVVGSVLAGWTIIYGLFQSHAKRFFLVPLGMFPPLGRHLLPCSAALTALVAIVAGCTTATGVLRSMTATAVVILVGLCAYAVLFAVNSAVHSYLVVRYAEHDKVAMDVGFYYMANAAGRLLGTLLGGVLYSYFQDGGSFVVDSEHDVGARTDSFVACLWGSTAFMAISTVISAKLRDAKPPGASAHQ